MSVGIGYDSHRFAPGRRLVLGGVEIEHEQGLAGHSDADEVWRRYFEALAECARSGLFDILAHPDLVKVWGSRVPVPEGDLRRFYDRALAFLAGLGVGEIAVFDGRERRMEPLPAASGEN